MENPMLLIIVFSLVVLGFLLIIEQVFHFKFGSQKQRVNSILFSDIRFFYLAILFVMLLVELIVIAAIYWQLLPIDSLSGKSFIFILQLAILIILYRVKEI